MMVIISINNFVANVLNAADLAIDNFVQASFNRLVTSNMETITLILVLFVILIGIRGMYRGFSLEDLLYPLIRMLFIYIMATKWEYFQLFFYDIFTKMPTHIISAMSASQSIEKGLNAIFSQGFVVANEIFAKGGLNNIAAYFWAIAVHIVNFGVMIVALGMIILAKFMSALYLFLGPIFIMFALFDATRQLSEKWLQQLITTALLPVLTCGVLLLSLSISEIVLGNLKTSVQLEQGILARCGEFVAFQTLSLYLLSQIPAKAAALAGGVALAGLNSAMQATRAFRDNNAGRANSLKNSVNTAVAGIKDKAMFVASHMQSNAKPYSLAAGNLANKSVSK